MSASASCLKCGTDSFRHSRWRKKDGALKRLFYSAVRCQACGHRRYRFNPWGFAVALLVILLTTFVAGVGFVISTDYGRADALSVTSTTGVISND